MLTVLYLSKSVLISATRGFNADFSLKIPMAITPLNHLF